MYNLRGLRTFFGLFPLKSVFFNVEKCPFVGEKKSLLREGTFFGLFPLKNALFKVEKYPFSQKSALLLERKKAFYEE